MGTVTIKLNKKGISLYLANPLNIHGAGGRNRTDMGWKPRGILSPVRLPVSPLRHRDNIRKSFLPVNFYLKKDSRSRENIEGIGI